MGIRYYDQAVYDKIQSWIPDNRVRILKPDETTRLFQTVADLSNDKPISLPLIAISRDRNITMDVSTRRPLSYDGLNIVASKDGTKSIQLNAIPILVHYQVDIYTQKYDEADAYLRELIFSFVNHPKLTIEFSYNGAKIEHIANLKLLSDVSDNSDISERLFPGQFTRWTLQLQLQDAYLFNTPVKDNWRIVEETPIEVEEPVEEVQSEAVTIGHNGFTHIGERETK